MKRNVRILPLTLITVTLMSLMLSLSGCSSKEPDNSSQSTQTAGTESGGEGTGEDKGDAAEQNDGDDNGDDNGDKEEKVMMRYEGFADWATGKLIENYWSDRFKIFVNSYPINEDDLGGLNYWWKAHAVDSMVDAYERTKDEYYMKMAKLAVKMTFELHGGMYNDFIDDMEWMCLACIRIYDNTQDEEFLDYAKKLWKDIKTSWWDDEVGGLGWNKTMLYNRNACSNGPGALIAARMYQRFGDEADLEWAKKIYNFLVDYLVDPETGVVWDGLVVKEDGSLDVNRDWVFSYNAGTFIGSAVELYKITGDEKYLRDAEKTSAGSIDQLTNFSTKLVKEEGQGDGGLFKGILIRYWVELYSVNKDEKLRDLIYANAESLRYKATTEAGLFGPNWGTMYSTPLDLTCQLSGHFLFEGAARMERWDNGIE